MSISNISHYQITNSLGRGGMGVVYKAIDQKLKRTVAIKTLPPEYVSDEKLRQRLMSEARAASRLIHPNICTIYEVDEADGILFIAMEYVAGHALSEEIRRGPIDVEKALDIAVQIAAGLDKAPSGSHDASTLLNAACAYAILGRKKEALSRLKEAIQNGYWHFDIIARDPDFNSLHDEPEFQLLINKQ